MKKFVPGRSSAAKATSMLVAQEWKSRSCDCPQDWLERMVDLLVEFQFERRRRRLVVSAFLLTERKNTLDIKLQKRQNMQKIKYYWKYNCACANPRVAQFLHPWWWQSRQMAQKELVPVHGVGHGGHGGNEATTMIEEKLNVCWSWVRL